MGLPPKFTAFRPEQELALELFSTIDERFLVLAMPPGGGKSLSYIAIHASLPNDSRTLILTSTKSLQTQLLTDFQSMGLRDLRGKSNYKCLAASYGGDMCDDGALPNHYVSVEGGPCNYGFECELKDKGCGYYDDERKVRQSRLVVTNYTKWMITADHEKTFGKFDLLVLDECHSAIQHVCDVVGVDLSWSALEHFDVHSPGTADDLTMPEWARWALDSLTILSTKHNEVQSALRTTTKPHAEDLEEARRLKRLITGLQTVTQAGAMAVASRWAVDDVKQEVGRTGRMANTGVRFEPIGPAPFAESWLFRNIPKVVMVSATVRPKTIGILGVKDDDMVFKEFTSSTPVVRRPVAYVPTVRLSAKSKDADIRKMLDRGNEIMEVWEGRNGLIHPTSYKLQRTIENGLDPKHKRRLVCPTSRETRSAVERLKANPGTGLVLNSPAIRTGVDFPLKEAEWAWIPKVPFIDARSNVMKVRDKQDKEYVPYLVAQELVQMSGRHAGRVKGDRGTTIITDGHIVWFRKAYRHLFPKWWLDAYRQVGEVPWPI